MHELDRSLDEKVLLTITAAPPCGDVTTFPLAQALLPLLGNDLLKVLRFKAFSALSCFITGFMLMLPVYDR